MIGTVEWRCVIGLFVHRKPKQKNQSKQKEASTKQDLSDLCGRLFVLALTFWLFNFELKVLCSVMDPQWNSLILAGDVESNPGPSVEDQLITLTKAVTDNFRDMKLSMDGIKTSVDIMREDLKSVSLRLGEIEQKTDVLQLDMCETSIQLEKFHDRIAAIEESVEKQEVYSRRENVILHGLPTQPNETYDSMCTRITTLLNDVDSTKDWKDEDILRSHRLRTQATGDKPVIVRFQQFTKKLRALKLRPALKQRLIGIANDKTQQQRNELSKLKANNQTGYFKNGKLVINTDRNAATDTATATATATANATDTGRRLNTARGDSSSNDRR